MTYKTVAKIVCDVLNGVMAGKGSLEKYIRLGIVNDILREHDIPEIKLDDCEEFVAAGDQLKK